ncbi:MFS transporter [Sphingorhabdus sp.]|jgi:predicted MFS family arabinose efflux permease|uniref:MFS transporter n=1 Tax=Sphingorhabdus sp. TaxID=1902408 RepID=UPI0037CACB28
MEKEQDVSTSYKLAILLTASICIAIGGIHYHVVGAMVKPLGDAYGWSRGDIAFALTISSAIHPFTNLVIGMLVDRYPARKVALPGILGFSVGTALLGFAGGQIWTWYALYAVFAVIGAGVSSIIYTKLVVQHFTKRRGLALAISLAGTGILVSTMPSIVLAFEHLAGLHGVFPMLALSAFILMFIPAWFVLPRSATRANPPAAALKYGGPGWRDIVGSTLLWRIAIAFLFVASCVGTFIVHFQPMLADAGLTREQAATVALFIGPAMIVGRLGTGFLFDILPTRLVATVAFLLPALACSWLYALPLDYGSAKALAILIGIGMGSEVDVVAYLSSRYFGTRHYGLVFGVLISIYGFAVGTSSWIVGKAYDASGHYDSVLVTLLIGVGLAVVLILSLGRPPEEYRISQ